VFTLKQLHDEEMIVILLRRKWFGIQKWRLKPLLKSKISPTGLPAVVETRSIYFSVSAAEIGPAEQVSVRPEVHGMIATLPVDLGDTVRRSSLRRMTVTSIRARYAR
jgi:hypothetical protein